MGQTSGKVRKIVFIVGCLSLMFFIVFKPATDPDLGWHFRNGQYLVQHHFQFPAADQYSYTMADFPVIMHEWLTDVLLYLLQTSVGFAGLSVVFSALIVTAFVVVASAFRARIEYRLVAGVLGSIASSNILGIRAQVITLLLTAVLLWLIYRSKEREHRKLIWLVPLLFLLWANMHGGFAVGLLLLFLFAVFESIKLLLMRWWPIARGYLQNQVIELVTLRNLCVAGLLSGLATLLNPYTYRIYVEIFRTLSDQYAKTHIMEWLPVSLHNSGSYQFIMYVVLLVILSAFAWRRLDISYVGIALVFGFLAFSSWRNLPLFMVMTIPFWVAIAQALAGRMLPAVTYRTLFLVLLMAAAGIIARQQLRSVVSVGNSVVELSKVGPFPYAAVQYLKTHEPQGNMFNTYNWGGFLIWQYPEQKVFIDGRMAQWNYRGKHILLDHDTLMLAHPGWADVIKRYDISWFLVYKNSVIGYLLKQQGWKEVYSDEVAEIIVAGDQKINY